MNTTTKPGVLATFSADDIVVLEVPLKRGKQKTVRFRTGNYPRPANGWTAEALQEMAASQVDRWLLVGDPRVVSVTPCRGDA